MALKDNVLTPEVEANGLGEVDMAGLDRAIGQIALTYDFKTRPKASEISISSLPAAGCRPQYRLRRPSEPVVPAALVALEAVSHTYGRRRRHVPAEHPPRGLPECWAMALLEHRMTGAALPALRIFHLG